MFWPIQPFIVQVFVLYLIGIGCATLLRLVRLYLVLHPISKSEPVTLESIREGNVSADSLVEAAFTGNLPTPTDAGASPKVGTQSTPEPRGLLLRLAEGKFLYLYDSYYTRISATRESSLLTIILSMLVFVVNLSDVMRGAWSISNPVESGAELFRKNLALSLEPLALGLFVSAILYGLSNIQEHGLRRRKAKWEYLCARLIEEFGRVTAP